MEGLASIPSVIPISKQEVVIYTDGNKEELTVWVKIPGGRRENYILEITENGIEIPELDEWVEEETNLNLAKNEYRIKVFNQEGKELL